MMNKAFNQWANSYRGIPRAVWLLALVNFINRFGGMVIAFFSLYLTQRLQLSVRDAGYVMTVFSLGGISGAYAGGWLTDKIGYKKVQFWSLVFNGCILIGLLEVVHFGAILCAAALWGFIGEIFRPANSVAVMRQSSEETRTRAFSVMRIAYNLGWTIAPALGGALISLWGWPALFWIDGLTCFAAAFLLWLLIHENKDSGPINQQSELSPTDPVNPLKDPQYLLFLLLTMLGAVVFMQIAWTIPLFFKEVYGWSEGKIGIVTALNGALVVLIEMPLIFRIEHRKSRLAWVRVGFMCYIMAYCALILPAPFFGLTAALLYIIAITMGEIFVMPFSSTWVTARAGDKSQGKYLSLYIMAYSVANVIAPMMGTQIIAAWGYNLLWMVTIGLGFVAYFGILRLQD